MYTSIPSSWNIVPYIYTSHLTMHPSLSPSPTQYDMMIWPSVLPFSPPPHTYIAIHLSTYTAIPHLPTPHPLHTASHIHIPLPYTQTITLRVIHAACAEKQSPSWQGATPPCIMLLCSTLHSSHTISFFHFTNREHKKTIQLLFVKKGQKQTIAIVSHPPV